MIYLFHRNVVHIPINSGYFDKYRGYFVAKSWIFRHAILRYFLKPSPFNLLHRPPLPNIFPLHHKKNSSIHNPEWPMSHNINSNVPPSKKAIFFPSIKHSTTIIGLPSDVDTEAFLSSSMPNTPDSIHDHTGGDWYDFSPFNKYWFFESCPSFDDLSFHGLENLVFA